MSYFSLKPLAVLSILTAALLTSCGGKTPPPTAQTSPASSPTTIASPSPSLTPSATPSVASPFPSVSPSALKLPDERSEEALAQLALLSLTSGQEARFKEKREFAPAIADLDKKWKPLEKYDIAMQPDGKEKVTITAKAKEATLKSYTAVVYGFNGDPAAVSVVTCGTLQPSRTPPALTAPAPATPKEQVFCPSGTYRSDGMVEPPASKKP